MARARKVDVMIQSSRKRSGPASRSTLLPSDDALAGAREKLPFFEPYDTRQLLADAERENNCKATDATLQALYIRRCRIQTAELLRALKCDPHDVQVWAHAFIKLASLHHNVGRLVHRRGGARANAKAWMPNDESLLLLGGRCAGRAGTHQPAGGGPDDRRCGSLPVLRETARTTRVRPGNEDCPPTGSLAQIRTTA
jgi:hypothetical protein